MSEIWEIQFLNWEKYQGPKRSDVKRQMWFRVDNNVWFHHKMRGLTVSEMGVFLFLLCEASSQDKHGSARVDTGLIPFRTKLLQSCVFKLEQKQVLTKKHVAKNTPTDNTIQTIQTDIEDTSPDVVAEAPTPTPCPTTNSKLDKKTQNKKHREDLRSELEKLYEVYPRKEKKKKGLDLLERQFLKEPTPYPLPHPWLARLARAIKNYTSMKSDSEKKFIMQFSTFAGCWEDYELLGDGAKTKSADEKIWEAKYA